MPMYAFRCDNCSKQFTVMTAWNRKHEVRCPDCGSDRLKEQWSEYTLAAIGMGDGQSGGCGCGSPGIGGG